MIPETLLTPRLSLRLLRRNDAPRLAELANDPDMARMLLHLESPFGLEQAQGLIWRSLTQAFPAERAIDDGKLQGVIELWMRPDGRAAGLGYWLGRGAWGKGYATEAAQAMLAAAFAGGSLEMAEAGVFVENTRSRRVLDKLGFQRHRLEMAQSRAREAPALCWFYRLTREDWRKRHGSAS